jgi:hypothetical protein
MEIMVNGFSKSIARWEIKKATELFGDLVLDARRIRSTVVAIDIRKMPKFKTERGMHVFQGYCFPVSKKKPKKFVILLNNDMTKRETIKTLAHEMVHVRQMRLNILQGMGKKRHRWFGRIVDENEEEYHKLPWESEAMLCEEPMYQHYRQCMKKTNGPARPNHENPNQSSQRHLRAGAKLKDRRLRGL